MNRNPEDDIAYIRELMVDTRRAACMSGGYFIVWGVAVGLALLITWLQLTYVIPYKPLITWTTCFLAGILGNIYFMRQDAQQPVQAPAGRLIGMVWLALGATQLIFFYASLGAHALPGEHMPAIFSSLIGTGVFMTGVLAGLPWLRNLAVGWWAGSLAMFIWPGTHVSLLMALMLFILYVIPGLVLIRMKRERKPTMARI